MDGCGGNYEACKHQMISQYSGTGQRFTEVYKSLQKLQKRNCALFRHLFIYLVTLAFAELGNAIELLSSKTLSNRFGRKLTIDHAT